MLDVRFQLRVRADQWGLSELSGGHQALLGLGGAMFL